MSYFTLLKIWDGTNTATVKAASTAAVATDTALVVAISPNNSIAIAGSDADNAVNSTKKMPVINAVANAANPSWTEAHEAPLSVRLDGNLRVVERPASPVTADWTMTAFNISAAGATTIVSGTGGKTTKIMRMITVNNGALGITSTQITIQDTAASAMNGPITLTTSGVINMPGNGEPYFVSGTGNGIQINSTNAVQICGTIWTEAN